MDLELILQALIAPRYGPLVAATGHLYGLWVSHDTESSSVNVVCQANVARIN